MAIDLGKQRVQLIAPGKVDLEGLSGGHDEVVHGSDCTSLQVRVAFSIGGLQEPVSFGSNISMSRDSLLNGL